MMHGQAIEAAARIIDPEAFELPPRRLVDVSRRDRARRAAADVLMIYEAHRLGVLGDAPPALPPLI